MDRSDWLERASNNRVCAVALMSRPGLHVPNQPFAPLSPALTDVLVLLALAKGEGLPLTRAEDELAKSRGAVTRAVLDLRNKFPGSDRFDTIVTHADPTTYEFSSEQFDIDLDQFEIELAQARHEFLQQRYAAAADRALDATTYARELLDPLAASGGLAGGIISDERTRLRWGVQWAWWIFARSCVSLGFHRPVEQHLRPIVRHAESEVLWGCYIFARCARSGVNRQSVLDADVREFRESMPHDPQRSITEGLITKLREASGDPDKSLLDAYVGEADIDPAEEFSWRVDIDDSTAISNDEIRSLVEASPEPPIDSPEPPIEQPPTAGDDQLLEGDWAATRRPRTRTILGAVFLLLCAVGVAVALRGQSADGQSDRNVLAVFDFDDLDERDLEVFTEPVTADAIRTTVGTATIESDGEGSGGVLVLRPNPAGEIGRSHHVSVAFRPFRELEPGLYVLSIRCMAPETVSAAEASDVANQLETGPEISLQVTKGGTTAVVGFQAVPNPWVNKLNIWSTADWLPLADPYQPPMGDWIDVTLVFDTASDRYTSLRLEAQSWPEPIAVDLSSIAIPYETKIDEQGQPFADGVVLSVEAQNQFTNPDQPESTRGEIVCDDLVLSTG